MLHTTGAEEYARGINDIINVVAQGEDEYYMKSEQSAKVWEYVKCFL